MSEEWGVPRDEGWRAWMLKNGVQAEPLAPASEEAAAVEWLIKDFAPYTLRPTFLAGAPASMKSYLCLAQALALTAGRVTVPGTLPMRLARVLYLDWETDRQTFERRIGTLSRGYDVPPDEIGDLFYHQMRGTLAESRERQIVRALVAGEGISLLIVDSAALAAGPGVDWAEAAVKLADTLTRFGCAALVVSQQSWESIEEGKGRPFGSVLNMYAAGLVMTIRKREDGTLVLRRTKFSEGKEQYTLALRPEWGRNSLRFRAAEAPETDPAPGDAGRERLLALVGDPNRPTHEIISVLMESGMSRRTAFRKLDLLRGKG